MLHRWNAAQCLQVNSFTAWNPDNDYCHSNHIIKSSDSHYNGAKPIKVQYKVKYNNTHHLTALVVWPFVRKVVSIVRPPNQGTAERHQGSMAVKEIGLVAAATLANTCKTHIQHQANRCLEPPTFLQGAFWVV
jgi:hypothetical protein